tara:strand:- start:48 stop:272 length:225 start_codon:yes stop_codon:yes gene_type:complete
MKRLLVTPENPNGVIVEYTAEEVAQHQADLEKTKAFRDNVRAEQKAKADLKASAKAKLIAGEPLTEAEADTIVL